ncbi:MAG: hypothetical protein AB7O56_09255 [Bauldia sp.]
MRRRIVAVIAGFAVAMAAMTVSVVSQPNGLDNSMYFYSDVRDADACRGLTYDAATEAYVWPAGITNPAMTCPDAFGWTQFADAIRDAFWANWAFDTFMWPAEPLALCEPGGTNCCDPTSNTNPGYDNPGNPALHCPFFPGDHGGLDGTIVPTGAHDIAAPTHGIIAQTDPGRVLREEEAEIVYRNRPFFEYAFAENLYNQEGLGARYTATTAGVTANAPYRATNAAIGFPSDAVMFKTDWIHQDHMLEMGLIEEQPDGPPNNPDAPYITMLISEVIGDNDPDSFKPGLYYLVGIAGAAKAVPNWHWYAFEHVANLGRCDYIGCNDAFGYDAEGVPDGFYANFVPPHQASDGLVTPSPVFVTGEAYPPGTITMSLDALFAAAGIGTGTADADPNTPSLDDPAWRSYRLKGTQTEFTTSYGIPIIVGQSISEGGFVNSASCMTCHAQATVNAAGTPAIASFGSSYLLNLTGYHQSTNGPPVPSWFFAPNRPNYTALQTDFVWGIFNANSIAATPAPTP